MCDHLIQRGNGQLKPHISLAKCKSERRGRELCALLSARLPSVEFPVNELLLLCRDSFVGRGQPFRLFATLPLLRDEKPRLFGPGSVEWTHCVHVVICGDEAALKETESRKLPVVMMKKRTKPWVAIVTFDSPQDASTFVSLHKSPKVLLKRQSMYP